MPSNEVMVSAASAWEVATKRQLGRLPSAGPIVAASATHVATLHSEELPVRSNHALLAGSFVTEHRDPFDRMLGVQALIEGIPLLTDDAVFAGVAHIATIW
jgi:PIN domain nuclease of toxin-antitoxin system